MQQDDWTETKLRIWVCGIRGLSHLHGHADETHRIMRVNQQTLSGGTINLPGPHQDSCCSSYVHRKPVTTRY